MMGRRRGTGRSNQKLHIYLDEGRSKPWVFQITPERYWAAARRHPALARRVKATFGPGPKSWKR